MKTIKQVRRFTGRFFGLFFLAFMWFNLSAQTIYIDPTNVNDPSENGSELHPFDSWDDVTWTQGSTYLQKAGTVFLTSGRLRPASNVKIGAYGTGAHPVFRSTGGDGTKILDLGGLKDVTIDGIEIESTNNATSCIHIFNSSNITLLNMKIHGAQWGIRAYYHTGKLTIMHTEVYNTGDDGMFIAEIDELEIGYCHVHDINQKWFISQDQTVSGGDCIQLGQTGKFHIHNNILDHSSTGNKFCFILITDNTEPCIFEYNTLKGPKLSPGGGSVYLTKGNDLTFRYNHFINSINGIYTAASNLKVYYNTFQEMDYAIVSAYPTGTTMQIYQNVFDNCENGILANQDHGDIKNNIFHNTANTVIRGKYSEDYNCFYPSANGLNIGENSFVGNPEFQSGTYHLSSSSSCIDAGTNLNLTSDIENSVVPQGSKPDMGVCEFDGEVAPPPKDENQAPVVNNQTFTVPENSANGTLVGTISASDPDAGQTLSYSLSGTSAFSVESTGGKLRVADENQLDYETNKSFSFTVTVTDNGTSTLSDNATITVNLTDVDENEVTAPAAPSNLKTSVVTSNSVSLSWTDNASNEESFIVEKKLKSATNYNAVETLSSNTTSYTDNNLDPSTTYQYRVKAINQAGSSAFSNIVESKTLEEQVSKEGPRVTEGILTLYRFNEGAGSVVNDVSGNGTPLNLTITEPEKVSWSGDGLSIVENTIIKSDESAMKINNGCQSTNEITMEAWITPGNDGFSDPSRIITLAYSDYMRAASLDLYQDKATALLNTTETENNGQPYLEGSASPGSNAPQHVVYTRDNAGSEKIYLNNKLIASGVKSGDFSGWHAIYILALGSEVSMNHPFNGTYHLVAVYSKALTVNEVATNYNAGITGDETTVNLIDNQEFSLMENSEEGTYVGTVKGSEDNINFHIIGGNRNNTFNLDGVSGKLTVIDNSILDYETNPYFELEVIATSSKSGTTSDTAIIRVNLTDHPEAPPVAPSKIDARMISDTEIEVTWEDKSVDEVSFIIERKAEDENDFSGIATVEANKTSYVNSPVEEGITYYYKVAATNEYGKTYSNIAVVKAEKPAATNRVNDGLVVLYDFKEGSGNIVHDKSGFGEPLDLKIKDESKVSWILEQGVELTSPTIIQSNDLADKIYDACKSTNEITIETWILPNGLIQDGPARVFTVSYSDNMRAGSILQVPGPNQEPCYSYSARLTTTSTNSAGIPCLESSEQYYETSLQHVVYTKKVTGEETLYVNGEIITQGTKSGNFDNWHQIYSVAIGNEITGNKAWLGKIYLAAVYHKALNTEQVNQNYDAGFDNIGQAMQHSNRVVANIGNKEMSSMVIDVYPNPTRGQLNVYLSNLDAEMVEINILATNGKIVASKTEMAGSFETIFNFDLSSLMPGMYLVRIVSGTKTATRKLIIN